MITLVFATGRTGTAFLSQVYGHGEYNKNSLHYKNKNLIAHEFISANSLPIKRLKQVGESTDEGRKISKKFLEEILKKTKRQYLNLNNFFITDHRMGRYLSWGLKEMDSYKIIYIERDRQQTIESFLRRWNKIKINAGEKIAQRYLINNWSKNYYFIDDFDCINKVLLEEWNNFSEIEKASWYWHETKDRWNKLKNNANLNYFEVSFDDIKNHNLDSLSKFLDMEPDLKFLNKIVNSDIKP